MSVLLNDVCFVVFLSYSGVMFASLFVQKDLLETIKEIFFIEMEEHKEELSYQIKIVKGIVYYCFTPTYNLSTRCILFFDKYLISYNF